jgi:two-component system response regulator HydG
MTDTLLESELFGHVRGAFTDAIRDRAGLFETARTGTLFLDEVGEMSPALQAKLLRALEGHEIRRVGSDTGVKATPRVIAATNRDLRAAVRAGAFREDLYYRLAAFVIVVPPLRRRVDAIPALAQAFLRRAASKLGREVPTIAPDAMRALVAYAWPGNVRELQHAIEHALILSSGSRISASDLPEDVSAPPRSGRVPEGLDLAAHERALIERALVEFGGNRRRAAEALHISTVTLWRRLKRHGLRTPQG